MNPEDTNTTDTQKLLSLMKEQNKELKLNKKKLEKLEEKFIKISSDNKNLLSDRANIETFLKNIFPKDNHDELIKANPGSYDSSDLSRLWLICESKNQNEYQTILSKHKKEISDLTEKNAAMTSQYDSMNEEYTKFKTEQKTSNDQLLFYTSRYNDVNAKVDSLEKEKVYLMKMLDEKNAEIELLRTLELENAELKAKTLLDNIDLNTPIMPYSIKKENELKPVLASSLSNNTNDKSQLKIVSLNIGCQTEEEVIFKKEVDDLKEQINNLQIKNIKLKKEFSDYKEKSHNIFLVNEENYNKILNQYETVKKELSQLLNQHNTESVIATNNLLMQTKMNNLAQQQQQQHMQQQRKYSNDLINQFDKQGDSISQKISLEYLKNVLLKYLEAISIGNEFQSKLLENVIFIMLAVTTTEKRKLEEKRATSSFYYNLWFNAKAYLSSKIYGSEVIENSKVAEITEDNNTQPK